MNTKRYIFSLLILIMLFTAIINAGNSLALTPIIDSVSPKLLNQSVLITQCGLPATPISLIQGEQATSPEVGNTHSVEAIVVGDFQNRLRGFFLQEETQDQDGNSNTSEGIFVFDNGFGVDVTLGDTVRVTGTVAEFFELTELNSITLIEVCPASGDTAPVDITLPLTESRQELEAFECMCV